MCNGRGRAGAERGLGGQAVPGPGPAGQRARGVGPRAVACSAFSVESVREFAPAFRVVVALGPGGGPVLQAVSR